MNYITTRLYITIFPCFQSGTTSLTGSSWPYGGCNKTQGIIVLYPLIPFWCWFQWSPTLHQQGFCMLLPHFAYFALVSVIQQPQCFMTPFMTPFLSSNHNLFLKIKSYIYCNVSYLLAIWYHLFNFIFIIRTGVAFISALDTKLNIFWVICTTVFIRPFWRMICKTTRFFRNTYITLQQEWYKKSFKTSIIIHIYSSRASQIFQILPQNKIVAIKNTEHVTQQDM